MIELNKKVLSFGLKFGSLMQANPVCVDIITNWMPITIEHFPQDHVS